MKELFTTKLFETLVKTTKKKKHIQSLENTADYLPIKKRLIEKMKKEAKKGNNNALLSLNAEGCVLHMDTVVKHMTKDEEFDGFEFKAVWLGGAGPVIAISWYNTNISEI